MKQFITYGSKRFIKSSKRIVKEAKSLQLFDECRRYSVNDLPIPIKSSPLFLTEKGGGFWLWKPYIIADTLSKMAENDILVYCDAGCTLQKSDKWNEYFSLVKNTNILFFQYQSDKDYGWSKFNPDFIDSPKIKYWAKRELVEHFVEFKMDLITEKNKLLAGFIIIRNTAASRSIINDWLQLMLYYPHLVADLFIHERTAQLEHFSQHRHDQSVISIIARNYEENEKVIIIDEDFETSNIGQVMRTERLVTLSRTASLIRRILKMINVQRF